MTDHAELFKPKTGGLAFKRAANELFEYTIIDATNALKSYNSKMILLIDWDSLSNIPAELKYKYGDTDNEEKALDNIMKFLKNSSRLKSLGDLVIWEFVQDSDCKEAFQVLDKLIFRVVHNENDMDHSGAHGYTYQVKGSELIVTLECNVTQVIQYQYEGWTVDRFEEVKKLMACF